MAIYLDPREINRCRAGIASSIHTLKLGYKPEALEKWIHLLADELSYGLFGNVSETPQRARVLNIPDPLKPPPLVAMAFDAMRRKSLLGE